MVVFGEIFLESYMMLLLFRPRLVCMSTYSISNTLGVHEAGFSALHSPTVL